jgi:GTP-binding protein
MVLAVAHLALVLGVVFGGAARLRPGHSYASVARDIGRVRVPLLQAGEESTAAMELERFFFDRAEVFVRSGAGGQGAIGFVGKRPAGGSGGDGGSVYLECSADHNTLAHLQGRTSAHASRGSDANDRQAGRRGADTIVRVPPNCLVVARDTNLTLGKLTHPGERLLVVAGGVGGEGNGVIWQRTRTGGKKRGAPGGTEKLWLSLSMTLVADIGLLGVPNAGKSTLMRAVTRARPKVADYPFTTLIPNLGVCELDRFGLRGTMVMLDIPGLIEGAAAGRGLGLAFLRHVERCRLLLHLVDGESDDPAAELTMLDKELALYSPKLAATPQVVILTKTDLPHVAASASEKLAALKAASRHSRVLSVSSHEGRNLQTLLKRTRGLLDQLDEQQAENPPR